MLLALAIAVSLLCVISASTFVVLRTIALVRGFRAAGGELSAALADVSAKAEAVSQRLERLEGETAEMDRTLARFARSRAQLGVLLNAWGEVRDSVTRLTAVRPQKRVR